MIGLWKMKKWATYAYALLVLLNQLVGLFMGAWNIMALIFPAIVVIIMFIYIKRMD
jgi:hypothetical protein